MENITTLLLAGIIVVLIMVLIVVINSLKSVMRKSTEIIKNQMDESKVEIVESIIDCKTVSENNNQKIISTLNEVTTLD